MTVVAALWRVPTWPEVGGYAAAHDVIGDVARNVRGDQQFDDKSPERTPEAIPRIISSMHELKHARAHAPMLVPDPVADRDPHLQGIFAACDGRRRRRHGSMQGHPGSKQR
jgi:hypothetical protein